MTGKHRIISLKREKKEEGEKGGKNMRGVGNWETIMRRKKTEERRKPRGTRDVRSFFFLFPPGGRYYDAPHRYCKAKKNGGKVRDGGRRMRRGKRVGATRLKATSLRTYVAKDGMGWFFWRCKVREGFAKYKPRVFHI